MNSEHIVAFCTVPNAQTGADIAKVLVDEQREACVNLIDGLRSIYRWQGEVCDDAEALLLIKTRRNGFESLMKRIIELHPYDTPEVIALPIIAGLPKYLDWIDASIATKPMS